jgi:type I restriction enzyme S subunit
MAGEWPVKTIAECASADPYSTQIGPFGKALMADEYTESGVPVLRGMNVNRGRFHDDDFVFVDDETADRLHKFESYPGDVLLVHKGTLGQIGLMPSKRRYERYIMGNSMMRVRCDPAKLLPEYLYYWLSSAEGQHYLFSRISQVGVPQIQTPLTTLRQATLPVPPLDEQRAITYILSSLDDKIELNRRMNGTLEAIARALFKSWFVDFDPVRAKAGGRETGLPKAMAGVFPDRFADSELGAIPAGWRVGTLGDLARRVIDKASDGGDWRADPLIDLGRMPTESVALTDWGVGAELTTSITRFRKRDILFGAIRPYFHKVGIAPINGVTNVSVFVIRPKNEPDRPFVSMLCSMTAVVEYATRVAKGTKMPVVGWRDFETYTLPSPPPEARAEFGRLVAPLLDRIISNIRQSRALVDVRESLLPKLMSGQLPAPQAEQLLERAPA